MDNLKLFSLDDNRLVELKKYCKAKVDSNIKPTPNKLLMKFVNEALIDYYKKMYYMILETT